MARHFHLRRFLAVFFVSSVVAPFVFAQTASIGATITFRKIFKSSYPEYEEIKLTQSGAGTYDIRQLSDTPNPQPLQIDASLAQKIFSLAAALHDFDGIHLESHRRIANLGQKTFIFTRGAETHQVGFNFTTNRDANRLLNIFEGLSRQESDLSDLKRTMRYDHLGVNDVMVRIESDYDQKLLPDPAAFLPALDQLAGDTEYVNIARARARNLAERIRNQR